TRVERGWPKSGIPRTRSQRTRRVECARSAQSRRANRGPGFPQRTRESIRTPVPLGHREFNDLTGGTSEASPTGRAVLLPVWSAPGQRGRASEQRQLSGASEGVHGARGLARISPVSLTQESIRGGRGAEHPESIHRGARGIPAERPGLGGEGADSPR